MWNVLEKVSSPDIYCDQPAEQVVHSSPSWRDNMLSAGKHGGVRSPLSVIGRSPGSRRLTPGDMAAKKAARQGGGNIALAKKAVAELIATVEMGCYKENATACLQQKQLSSTADKLVSVATNKLISINRVQATDSNMAQHVETEAELDPAASDDGVEIEKVTLIRQKDIQEDDFSGDDENKENIFCGWVPSEMSQMTGDNFDVNRMVIDTVEQLDRQARTLRRRSQLSTDSSEYESILQQLRLIRQRQAELECLQRSLQSRLLHCRTNPDEPLNLKLNSDRDVVEPLDLRVPSVKQEQNSVRVILADITCSVVGDADPDDCFEVPDSPPAAAADDEPSGPNVEDAANMDGVAPIFENFPGSAPETEGNFEETGQMKSTPLSSSPAVGTDGEKAHAVRALDQYLASLNVSDISEASPPSPVLTVVASPDASSEFANYQTYQRPLDVSGRCVDPVAAALFDGDEQVCYLH